MVLACEKGRMMVGLGRERGRSFVLRRDVAREEEEGYRCGWVAMTELRLAMELVGTNRKSCLMATFRRRCSRQDGEESMHMQTGDGWVGRRVGE